MSEHDPELEELDKQEPEVGDEDEDVSSENDGVDEPEAEDYDPANDGDDSILAEVAKEELTPDA
jgi:hypothetical protein